jgi:hypothetical protein
MLIEDNIKKLNLVNRYKVRKIGDFVPMLYVKKGIFKLVKESHLENVLCVKYNTV